LSTEGRTVLIHCVDPVSRTPAAAALYAARHLGIPFQQALTDVRAVLPAARPNAAFMAALDRLGATSSRPYHQISRPRGAAQALIALLPEPAVSLREWCGGCEDD
jgi:predicted protein tyrosine phosphatase